MDNLNTKPIKDGDTYKYLSIDENISFIVSNERIFS